MLIAQITDLHIFQDRKPAYGLIDTARFLEEAVAHILALPTLPDVVVATGDLVDKGSANEYAILRDILTPLPMPLYLMPGNHDARETLRDGFPEHAYLRQNPDWIQYVIEDHPLRLITLDTLVPGKGHGVLCADRLAWLDSRLAEGGDRPTIVMLHHPPFKTGIAHMDRMGLLEGAEELGGIVARYPNIERILCGHLHRPIQIRWNGTLVSIAPSTAHQINLDLREDGPPAFIMEPPALHLHDWRPEVGLVTHHSYIGDHPGPFLFNGGAPVPKG